MNDSGIGIGQGNGYEIREGELVPCVDTLADGFLNAIQREGVVDSGRTALAGVGSVEEFLDRTPGTATAEEPIDRPETGLDI